MNQFWVDSHDIQQQTLLLGQSESDHALRVMRMQAGDRFYAVDGCGKQYFCEMTGLRGRRLSAAILNIREPAKKGPSVTLVLSLCKFAAMEIVFQKATELGCDHYVVMPAKHSVVKKVSDHKKIRWAHIVQTSVKQCQRCDCPKISYVDHGGAAWTMASQFDGAFLPTCAETSPHLRDVLSLKDDRRFVCAIGPEGDFHSDEIALARSQGWQTVNLGERVLRSETAALYVLSNIL